nr:MAG TPA: short tail fiber protein [Caudoviricetes sp.]
MGLDASRQVPTASENRPVNMAVNILIKAYD